MTDNRSDERQQLFVLADALLEDVFSMSDEELIAETEEDDNLVSVPIRMRELYQQTLVKKRKSRLKKAKDDLRSATLPQNPAEVIDISEAREAVTHALESKDLSIAARNETSSELSDADIIRKYHDLVALGIINPED